MIEGAFVPELSEPRWAVASERGMESLNLTYSAARELVSKLTGEDVRGLCIITNESAQRIAEEKTRDKTSTEESVTSAK
ncbi:MAG: hypothetical protein H0V88_12270 [Pyrinomonadaceae bacterium]|nr:hypothetical protein [Pyrinomonadaceae bacterium]